MFINNLIKIADDLDHAIKKGASFSLSSQEEVLLLKSEESFSLDRDQRSLTFLENWTVDAIREVDWRVASRERKEEGKRIISLLERAFEFFEEVHKGDEFLTDHKESVITALYLGGKIPAPVLERDDRAFTFLLANDLPQKLFDFGLSLKMKEGEVAIPFEINPFEYGEFSFSDFEKRKRTKVFSYEWKGRVVCKTHKNGVLTKHYKLTPWGISHHG